MMTHKTGILRNVLKIYFGYSDKWLISWDKNDMLQTVSMWNHESEGTDNISKEYYRTKHLEDKQVFNKSTFRKKLLK